MANFLLFVLLGDYRPWLKHKDIPVISGIALFMDLQEILAAI